MKVLLDTNVFLSYLLTSNARGTIATVVRTCFEHEDIDLLVPHEQIGELASKVATKDYFRTRIPNTLIQTLIQELTTYCTLPPQLEDIKAYTRDPKDDYLVAYAIVNEADYLITGDNDLLVLGRVGALEVVTPTQFIDICNKTS